MAKAYDFCAKKVLRKEKVEWIMSVNITGTVKKLKSNWNSPPEGRCLTFKEIGAYSLGGLGYSCLVNTIYVFLTAAMIPYMYNIKNVHGTNIATAVTVLNLIIMPVFAKLFDNCRAKMGKFKLFFTLVTPVIGLFTIAALWVPQSDAETFRTVYAYLTCTPTLLLTGIYAMLYTNMPTVMTTNNQERADVLAPANLIVGFAPTVLNAIVPIIRGHFKKIGQEYIAYRIISILFVILGIIMSILIVKFVKERVYVTESQKKKIKFWNGIKLVLKNKPLMTFQMISIFNALRTVISLQFYFVAMYKYSSTWGEGEQIFGALSLITGFGATPAMILTPILIRKIRKKDLMILSQALFTLPIIGIMLCGGFETLKSGTVTIVVMTVLGFLMNFNTGIGVITTPTITGEQYDYQQYQTGQRLEGFMSAVAAWTSGIFGALLMYIPVFFQSKIGFEQGADRFQGASAYLPENMAIIDKWFNCVALITIAASLIWMIGLKCFYKLDEKKHAEIMKVLKEKALNADNPEETAAEIQQETTRQYPKLNNEVIEKDQ